MKRYFVSAGLVLMSFVYLVTQHANGTDASTVTTNTDTGTSSTDTGGITYSTSTTSTGATSSDTSSGSTATTGTSDSGSTSGSGTTSNGAYKDGSYTGTAANAYYGYVQVKAIVSGGKLAAVQILEYPNDRSTSRYINSQALPYLEQEAIAAQSANVSTISGASDTSMAFRESLASALSGAAV